jgi:DNA-binding transcriptional MerR regulator
VETRTATPQSRARLLLIGELAERAGVATSALRYYEERGLVQPVTRESGGRRLYSESALAEVGVIRFLSEVGFTLAEIASFVAAGDGGAERRELIRRKTAQITEQQKQLEVARELLEHGDSCPAGDPLACERFWSIIEHHRCGLSLEDSHASVHGPPLSRSAD